MSIREPVQRIDEPLWTQILQFGTLGEPIVRVFISTPDLGVGILWRAHWSVYGQATPSPVQR